MATREAEALQKKRDEELRLKELQEMNRKLDFIIQHLRLGEEKAETEVASVSEPEEGAVASESESEPEKKPRKSGK